MQEELHVFIIWSKGLRLQEPIIDDLKKHLEIKKIFNCHWEKKCFAAMLSLFYGKKLPSCCKKEKSCGNDDFLVIVVSDAHPRYESGINVNISSLKHKYRCWFGGGFLIHASDNATEAAFNLKFLTGLTPEEFLRKYPEKWNNAPFVQISGQSLPIPRRQNIYLQLLRGLNMLF